MTERGSDGTLRYRCSRHGIYVVPPRRFVRWENGEARWSTRSDGPFIEDHSKCPENTWSEERE
jgi:hypothetical protein